MVAHARKERGQVLVAGFVGLLLILAFVLRPGAAAGRIGPSSSPGHEPAPAGDAASEPTRSGARDARRVEAKREVGGGSIRGRTIGTDGGPVSAVIVSDANGAETRSDGDGAFVIAGLAPGTHTLQAECDGRVAVPSGPIVVRSDETIEGVDLVLDRACFAGGCVTTTNGVPLAGARVTVRLHAAAAQPQLPAVAFAGAPKTVVTDADGRFRIGPFIAGEIALTAEHDVHAPFARRYPSDAADLRIVLEPISSVHGVVFAPDGSRPVAIERLLLLVADGNRGGCNVATEVSPNPEEVGRFWLPVLTPREVHVVAVTREFGLATSAPFRVPRGFAHGPIELRAAGGLPFAGRIHDDSGSPVAGAEVRVRSSEARFEPAHPTSGPDGAFACMLAPGRYTVQVRKSGHATLHLPLELSDDSMRPLDCVLARGGTLRGRIAVPPGAALPALEVIATFAGQANQPPAVAFVADRAYHFDHLPPGDYRVSLRERGDVAAPTAGEFVHVAVAVTVDVDLQPRQFGLACVGGVLTCEDRPVSFASVRVMPGGGRVLASTIADRCGRFEFDGLPAQELTVVVSEAPAGPCLARHRVEVRSGETRALALVVACGAVRGRVVAAATRMPFAAVTIQIFGDDGFAVASTRSDAHGEFQLPRVPQGQWTLGYSRPGETTCRQVSVRIASRQVVQLTDTEL